MEFGRSSIFVQEMGVLLRVVAGKGFQHKNNNNITACCSKEPGNTVETVLWFSIAGNGP